MLSSKSAHGITHAASLIGFSENRFLVLRVRVLYLRFKTFNIVAIEYVPILHPT